LSELIEQINLYKHTRYADETVLKQNCVLAV